MLAAIDMIANQGIVSEKASGPRNTFMNSELDSSRAPPWQILRLHVDAH